ncbi:MAG TPA: hypothetical protein VNH83_16715 [Bryobacteraceae bacterium]|nr:hypothetical protein [Bryobacteraceae bacterium]
MAAAEEKLFSGSGVASGSGVICGQITRMYPSGQRLQFPLAESKWWHPTRCSVFDHISNLTFIASPQAAAVDQRRGSIPAFSPLAVANLAKRLELLFGMAEIRSWTGRNLTNSLDRCQNGCTGKPGVSRPLTHESHHFELHMIKPKPFFQPLAESVTQAEV